MLLSDEVLDVILKDPWGYVVGGVMKDEKVKTKLMLVIVLNKVVAVM